jgi:hypothetical protein
MKAVQTSETLVNLWQSTRHYKPKDSHLPTHRRENLKSTLLFFINCAGAVLSFVTPLAGSKLRATLCHNWARWSCGWSLCGRCFTIVQIKVKGKGKGKVVPLRSSSTLLLCFSFFNRGSVLIIIVNVMCKFHFLHWRRTGFSLNL